MSITKDQQQALDDALVPREQRLRIGNCNYRLSTTFKLKEPTFQIALDDISLTPFYQAFLIYANVPAIYMHEFWATICPNLPGLKFVDPPFEEEILAFIRKLGYSRDIKSLPDVKVDTLYQPWRTFGTIINKCLSGKEDLVYQIENKESKRNKDMYYPRFTKVIINHFMSKDQSIPRRNKVDWHMARDDPILTTMRYISKHEIVQKYSAILPDTLTNQEIKESDAYKTYYAFAYGKEIPKTKYVRPSTREKTIQAPKAFPGQRLKTTAKVAKSGKKKLPATVPKAKGLETLSEVELSKDEARHNSTALMQVAQVIELTLSQRFLMSNNKGSLTFSQDEEDADEETDMNDDSEETKFDDDGDNLTHPNLSTYKADDEKGLQRQKEAKTVKNHDLYRDVNINLERSDAEMTDA
ncbi:hypothetical protein Tco_0902318 [Tanacetum coccineum]